MRQIDGEKTRLCNVSMFFREIKNGDKIKRNWTCFSTLTGKLYCFHCKIFQKSRSSFYHGYSDWKNAWNRLKDHEQSSTHMDAVLKYTLMTSKTDLIDVDLKKQIEKEKEYWRILLKRIIDVIKYLVKRNLSFRGSDEIIGSVHNGNFLGLIELLADYDDFLKTHLLQNSNCGSGKTNHLSHHVYTDILEIMHGCVTFKIVEYIQASRYFSITVDSTRDVSHKDQLSLSIR